MSAFSGHSMMAIWSSNRSLFRAARGTVSTTTAGRAARREGAVMSVNATNRQPFAIEFDRDAIVEFCRRWAIRQLSLFGSVLHPEEFRADSDVDVLVEFEDGHHDWGPWGSHWEEMVSELATLFGRKVDLVERQRIDNPFIRHSILTTRQVVYAA